MLNEHDRPRFGVVRSDVLWTTVYVLAFWPLLVAVCAACWRVFVAHGDSVARFDIARQVELPAIGVVARGHAVVPLPDGQSIAVTSGRDATVRFSSVADGQMLASIAVGANPDAALLDPATGHLLTMNSGAGTVSDIDPQPSRRADDHRPARVGIGCARPSPDALRQYCVRTAPDRHKLHEPPATHTNNCSLPVGARRDKAAVLTIVAQTGRSLASTRGAASP